jgi:hypothetical protein
VERSANEALVDGLKNDPDVQAIKRGTVLPAPVAQWPSGGNAGGVGVEAGNSAVTAAHSREWGMSIPQPRTQLGDRS